MVQCKHLKGNGSTWYNCDLRKKRCAYQRYCPTMHKFVTDGCIKCPAFSIVSPDSNTNPGQK